jgi:hypothetical protein
MAAVSLALFGLALVLGSQLVRRRSPQAAEEPASGAAAEGAGEGEGES